MSNQAVIGPLSGRRIALPETRELDRLAGMLEAEFLDGLRSARKITRGPKPERALRELGLKSDLRAETPTTDGLMATLSALGLRGRRVGVQLYPGAPEARFVGFLREAGA